MTAASFHVLLPGVVEEDVLGVWETQTGRDWFAALAAAEGPAREPAALWQIELPADYRAAAEILAERERRLSSAEGALADVDRRLRALRNRFQKEAAFDRAAFDAAALPLPEQELAATLFRAPARAAEGEAFGVHDLVEDAQRLAEEARRFIANAAEMVRSAADVETVQTGATVARTRVYWHGDAENLSLPGLSEEQAELHCRDVALALRTRTGWLSTASHYAANLIVIGAGVATGNPVLVAGGVWRFLKRVLADWRG